MAGGPAPLPPAQAVQSWTSGAKDLVMTALGTSRVWATTGQGIFTEIYWPAVDQPQVKDLGFLVGGTGWWQEVKRAGTLHPVHPGARADAADHRARREDQAYQLTLRPVVDPDHDALLIDYELTGEGVRLYPLLAPHLGISQITPESQWAALGADNQAWTDPADLAMFASGSGGFLCLLARPGFTRAGAGYVGDTDGWTDFSRHQSMTLTYGQAGPGVVALTGELAAGSGLLALGFGDRQDAARAAAQASLDAGYDATAAAFTRGWRAWTAGLTLPGPAQLAAAAPPRRPGWPTRCGSRRWCCGPTPTTPCPAPTWPASRSRGGTTPTTPAATTWCGAGTAGRPRSRSRRPGTPTTPRPRSVTWPAGSVRTGRGPGASSSAGCPPPSIRRRRYSWMRSRSRCCSRASSTNSACPCPRAPTTRSRQAAGYLARNGPVSSRDVDRWEENAGASPFTIGLEIVAMLVAATRLTGPDRTLARALADNWNERLEEFTFVSGDEIDQAFGTDGHYVRIGLPGGGRVEERNQPQGTQPVDAAALVGLEFAYLPRLGLRDPADKRVTDTLAIAEAMLGADTPSGRAYHRYDVDGYGEWLDGSGWPVRKFGIGRPWPLLAGERGHLDVLAGGDATTQLRAMLAMRGRGGLLPEQIWDANPLPWQNLRPGQPTGSAMPLAWAHSELIKLAVAAATGKPVELLALVSDRYRAVVPASRTWFWRESSPVQALPAGRTLVVADLSPFTLHYGFDDWDPATITERDAQGLGLGLFGVTLTPADLAGRASLQFVRRYQDGRWEGATRHDVALGAPGPGHPAVENAGSVAASGNKGCGCFSAWPARSRSTRCPPRARPARPGRRRAAPNRRLAYSR